MYKDFETTIINIYKCVDEYTLDHLIIFLALAKGTSKIRTNYISKHTETALYLVNKILNAEYSINNLHLNNECNSIKGYELIVKGIDYSV